MKGTRLKRGKRQRRPFEREDLAAGTVLFPSVPRGGLPFPLGPPRGSLPVPLGPLRGSLREGGGLAEPAVDRAQRSIRPKAPLTVLSPLGPRREGLGTIL